LRLREARPIRRGGRRGFDLRRGRADDGSAAADIDDDDGPDGARWGDERGVDDEPADPLTLAVEASRFGGTVASAAVNCYELAEHAGFRWLLAHYENGMRRSLVQSRASLATPRHVGGSCRAPSIRLPVRRRER
jgi:hypothetical protein